MKASAEVLAERSGIRNMLRETTEGKVLCLKKEAEKDEYLMKYVVNYERMYLL